MNRLTLVNCDGRYLWVDSEMRRILGNENCGWNNFRYLKLDCCYILEGYWACVGHSFNLLCLSYI